MMCDRTKQNKQTNKNNNHNNNNNTGIVEEGYWALVEIKKQGISIM